MLYIVNNQYGAGLNVRSKPDTQTGQIIRFMTNGEGFQTQDVFTVGNQQWARVSIGDQVKQEYVCLQIGNKIYARPQTTPTPQTQPSSTWAQAIDQWARSKGYNGQAP